jgi:hypothetical protein
LSIWKNKHLLVATLMAPVLGLVSYFGINTLLSESPQVAEAGQSYILVEKSNCRYSSGLCGLKNVDFELELSFERLAGDRLLLKLTSEHTLDGVMMARLVNEDDENPPKPMRSTGPDGLNWAMEIRNPDPQNQRLHLVASSNEVFYIGDVALKFTINEIESK